MDTLRTPVDRIFLEPGDGRLGILIKGDIAGILIFAAAEKNLPAKGARGRQVPVVAGAGLGLCDIFPAMRLSIRH